MDKRLYKSACQGDLILTVNDRLSRHLARSYDLRQQARGLNVWTRPNIFSLSAWMLRNQQMMPQLPGFLNTAQLQTTWEAVIEDDIKGTEISLLNLSQTARRAMQAHQLLVRYSADFNEIQAAQDHKTFLRWRALWLNRAAENQWHDPVELPGQLAAEIRKKSIKTPDRVVAVGFDEITPDILTLFDALKKVGTDVDFYQPLAYQDPVCRRLDVHDMREEVLLCSRWIRQKLAENPEARIGVVAPQMDKYQSLIENIFIAELSPRDYISCQETQQVYNISLGHSLDQEGVVFAALKLLKLNNRITYEDISWLFCTSYLGSIEEERAARALLDQEIRKKRSDRWGLSRLLIYVQKQANKKSLNVSSLSQGLKVLDEDITKTKRRMLPGLWAEHFTQLLNRLGWPGRRGLSSREYQAVEQFRGVLGLLASLDDVSGKIDRSEAVQALSRLVSAHEFQAEGVEASVQVLGELESAGLGFDNLWIMGLHDGALPKAPNPNPFIPLPVQRQHRMKRVDAEREYQFAEQIANRLFRAAPEIVVSSPLMENGTEQRPSPFIKDMPVAVPLALSESCMPANVTWSKKPVLEKLTDDLAPPLSTRKPFSGGTGIIKDQALCPFRAFAHHRLNAEGMDVPDIGIDNMERGTLAHKVLELFWNDVGDQDTLLGLDADSLARKVHEVIAVALKDRYDLPVRQRHLESQRLQVIIMQWLAVEAKRSHFSVLELEKSHSIQVGNLVIRTRIDRVDEIDDGTMAIIDYKTGRPDPAQWLEDRVTDPQLPLYSLNLSDNDVGAVMFAEVRSKEKECGFRGVARSVDSWPGAGLKKLDNLFAARGWSSFDDILLHWEKVLPELGDEFGRGEAAVKPVDVELACKYCDLTALCRILETKNNISRGEDD